MADDLKKSIALLRADLKDLAAKANEILSPQEDEKATKLLQEVSLLLTSWGKKLATWEKEVPSATDLQMRRKQLTNGRHQIQNIASMISGLRETE